MSLRLTVLLIGLHFITSKTYRLALIPKNSNNPFYEEAYLGFKEEALLESTNNETSYNITCDYMPPNSTLENVEAGEQQLQIIKGIIQNKTHDGIAIAPLDGNNTSLIQVINEAIEMDIEVVTFDSDSKRSERKIHIGTDDLAFGDMLGKLLLQLEPKGGDYSVITAFPSQNLAARVKGLKNVLDGTKWNYFGPEKGVNGKGSRSESLLAMSQILDNHHSKYPHPEDRPPFAIVPVGAWPMLDIEGWKDYNKKDEDTTLICADAVLSQIQMLKLDYVDGLVGQLPAEMGRQSVINLTKLLSGDSKKIQPSNDGKIVGTNLLQFLRVPLILPEVQVDINALGSLKILSYILFSIVAVTVISLGLWTWKCKTSKVVSSSQPIFLYLILAGALIMSATIVSLTEEDQDLISATCEASVTVDSTISDQKGSITANNAACNLNFYFLGIGFTLIFAALFSKSLRLNRIIKASKKFKKVTITVKDVMLPLFAMLAAIVAVLMSWTLHDPLKYIPKAHSGTDEWNRPISCYGVCDSKFATAYAVVIFLVALFSLTMALVQAYQTRTYRTAFNESNYIGIATVSILQAGIIGVLIYALTRDQPRIMVPIISLTIFFASMAVILFIFVPKILSYREEISLKGKQRRTFVTFGAGFEPRSKEIFSRERDLRDISFNRSENNEEEKCELKNPQHESQK